MSGLIDDFDLFIFDWDGTISTSSVLVRLSHYFKRRYNPEYIRSHESEFRQPRSVNSPFGANRMRLANFFYGLYTFFVRTHLREGAIEMLEILKKKNKKVALFTDGSRHRVESELKRLGMAKYFDIIISAESIRVYKPNPTGINMIIKEMRANKSRCLYIGDMAIDIFTARFAGIKVCSVANGLEPVQKLKATKPDYLFESMLALAKASGPK